MASWLRGKSDGLSVLAKILLTYLSVKYWIFCVKFSDNGSLKAHLLDKRIENFLHKVIDFFTFYIFGLDKVFPFTISIYFSTLPFYSLETWIIFSSKDRSIAVWDMVSPREINMRRVLVGHRAAVNVVDFDDRYIVSASGDRTIKVFFFEFLIPFKIWGITKTNSLSIGSSVRVNILKYMIEFKEFLINFENSYPKVIRYIKHSLYVFKNFTQRSVKIFL